MLWQARKFYIKVLFLHCIKVSLNDKLMLRLFLTATSFFDTVSLRLDMIMEVRVVIPLEEEWCPAAAEEYVPREMGAGGGEERGECSDHLRRRRGGWTEPTQLK